MPGNPKSPVSRVCFGHVEGVTAMVSVGGGGGSGGIFGQIRVKMASLLDSRHMSIL